MSKERSIDKLVDILIKLGFMKPEQIPEVEESAVKRPSMSTGDLVVDLGIVTEAQVKTAEEKLQESGGGSAEVLRERFKAAEGHTENALEAGRALQESIGRKSLSVPPPPPEEKS